MLPLRLRRVLVVGAAVATLAGCTSAAHHKASGPGTSPSSRSAFVATRWWSNAAVTAGSKIDPAHPEAAAKNLRPSAQDYCAMLKQTVAAGKSILGGVTSTDPALLTSAKAFIAEIEQVAPAGITRQWQVVGPAVLSLVRSGGDTASLPAVDLGGLTKAANAIAADSRANCGVDLSSVTGLLPKK